MLVPVMNVRIMRVCVNQRFMPVRMCMRLAAGVARPVRMFMVRVVPVKMPVFRWLVLVFMLVPFGEVQPDARAHEPRRNHEPQREAVPQKQNRKGRTHKWRDGKVSARPSRAQVAQR